MNKTIYMFLFSAVVSGCATTDGGGGAVAEIPVRVPCVQSVPEAPESEIKKLTESSSDFNKIKALTTDYLSQKQYINELEAVIAGCR